MLLQGAGAFSGDWLKCLFYTPHNFSPNKKGSFGIGTDLQPLI